MTVSVDFNCGDASLLVLANRSGSWHDFTLWGYAIFRVPPNESKEVYCQGHYTNPAMTYESGDAVSLLPVPLTWQHAPLTQAEIQSAVQGGVESADVSFGLTEAQTTESVGTALTDFWDAHPAVFTDALTGLAGIVCAAFVVWAFVRG